MERYTISARILHWLMAAGFVFMWACGYVMTALAPDDSPLQEFLFGLHISIGVTLLFLLALRLGIRVLNTVPPLPDGLAEWEKTGARLGHVCLYLLPAAIILVGWAETDFGGHGVEWFGLAMPKLFPTLKTLWGWIWRRSPQRCMNGSPTRCWRSRSSTSQRSSSIAGSTAMTSSIE